MEAEALAFAGSVGAFPSVVVSAAAFGDDSTGAAAGALTDYLGWGAAAAFGDDSAVGSVDC